MAYKFRKIEWVRVGTLPSGFRKTHNMPRRQSVRYNSIERDDIFKAWVQGVSFHEIAWACERKTSAVYGEWQDIMRRRGLLR